MNDMSLPLGPRPLNSSDLPENAVFCGTVPDELPLPDLRQNGRRPAATYRYSTTSGKLSYLIARYETIEGKRFCPVSVWSVSGSPFWVLKGPQGLSPLYRLPELLAKADKPVLLVEGEKCADAAASFSGFVAVTWRGGAKALARSDFTPLKGRDVILMPDDDAAGEKAADQLVAVLRGVGVSRLRVLRTPKLLAKLSLPTGAGGDIADAIDAGLREGQFNAQIANLDMLDEVALPKPPREEPRETPDDPSVFASFRESFGADLIIPDGFVMDETGLYKTEYDRRGMEEAVFAGSPIAVLGRTRLAEGRGGWGYRVALLTPLFKWDLVTLPARLLAGDGRELREILAEAGFVVPQQLNGRRALAEYIAFAAHGPILTVTPRPGWAGESFALPDQIIAAKDASTLTIDMGERPHYLATGGNLKCWQAMAALAASHPQAVFALCAAFAAPLLKPMGMDGGGFHFYGQSSRGKTTLLTLAGSVWGGGGRDGFVRNWRSTDNGIEGVVSDHNDLLLCLDEMTLAPPELVAEMVYMLANGHGKARAKKDGTAAKGATWTTLILSSGEKSTAQTVEQSRSKTQMTGGMAVRMVDVPIGSGDFSPPTPFATTGGYMDHLKAEARNHFGHAGRAFVAALVADREALLNKAQTYFSRFMERLVIDEDDPQVARVARRFALVGTAGVMAEKLGILPGPRKQILAAVETCFSDWKEARGGGQSEERRNALRDLRYFFEAHGPARFENLQPAVDDRGPRRMSNSSVRDRCGYRVLEEDDSWLYYILPAAWSRDVAGHHCPDLMARIALEAGALERGEGNHRQKKARLPDFPNGTRVYALRPDRLPEA